MASTTTPKLVSWRSPSDQPVPSLSNQDASTRFSTKAPRGSKFRIFVSCSGVKAWKRQGPGCQSSHARQLQLSTPKPSFACGHTHAPEPLTSPNGRRVWCGGESKVRVHHFAWIIYSAPGATTIHSHLVLNRTRAWAWDGIMVLGCGGGRWCKRSHYCPGLLGLERGVCIGEFLILLGSEF